MRNLYDLDARHSALGDLILCRIERHVAPAETAIAGLIEALDKRDVEIRGVGAEPEIYIGQCPGMRASEVDGAAV
jgi:hypothetical protein